MGPIKLDIGGLKCDAAGCGWRDDSVTRRQYPNRRNTECPRCSANVLTDADWRRVRWVEFVAAVINTLLFFIKSPTGPAPGVIEHAISTDGTGRAIATRVS